jgi:DNA-binding NarL/FixJ family response regulator
MQPVDVPERVRALAVPLVVVDDHHMIVLGLRSVFQARPEVQIVAWAHDAEEAMAACRAHQPAVAVLDVALDGSAVDGIELCERLHAELPRTAVVFYTGMVDLGLAEKALAAGAKGVVSKSDRSSDLLKAVLLASRGKTYTSPVFAARADRRDFEELPPKQLAALRLLAQGLDRKQIAEQMGVGEETVKSHLSEVRRKLNARTSAHAVAIGLINSLFDYPGDEQRPADGHATDPQPLRRSPDSA